MLALGTAYARANKKDPHYELLVRAALGYGMNDLALETIEKALKEFPTDANLLLTAAKVHCRMRNWAACKTSADAASAAADKVTGDERSEITSRAAKYQTRAELHLGNLDSSELLGAADGGLLGQRRRSRDAQAAARDGEAEQLRHRAAGRLAPRAGHLAPGGPHSVGARAGVLLPAKRPVADQVSMHCKYPPDMRDKKLEPAGHGLADRKDRL